MQARKPLPPPRTELERFLREKNITPKDGADETGIPYFTFVRYVSGKRTPARGDATIIRHWTGGVVTWGQKCA